MPAFSCRNEGVTMWADYIICTNSVHSWILGHEMGKHCKHHKRRYKYLLFLMCMKLWMKKKTQWRCCMRNITIIHSVISQAQKYYSWYSRGICTTLCETMYYKERNMTVLDQRFNQISLTLLQFVSNRLSNRQLSRNGVLDHHQRWGKAWGGQSMRPFGALRALTKIMSEGFSKRLQQWTQIFRNAKGK